MTYSVAARCPETGMFGIGIATSSIAVGNRCPWARAGVGAVTTQHRSDIRLGPLGLDLLAAGKSADETVAALVAQSEFPGLRQIGVVDREDRSAFYSGPDIQSIASGTTGPGCVATGNALANPDVPAAALAGYQAARGSFAERLLAGVDAGLAAGGETQPLMAAALLIVDKHSWPLVDLRVDFQEEPGKALRRLWIIYEPQVDHFLTQVLRPYDVRPAAEREAAQAAAVRRARAI